LSGRRSPATPTSSITCPRPTVPYTSPGRSGNSSRPELTRHRALRSGLARGRVRLLFILTMTIRWLLAALHLRGPAPGSPDAPPGPQVGAGDVLGRRRGPELEILFHRPRGILERRGAVSRLGGVARGKRLSEPPSSRKV